MEASGATLLTEELPGRPHPVLEREDMPYFLQGEGEWKVPPGQYFVMGDNRDNSEGQPVLAAGRAFPARAEPARQGLPDLDALGRQRRRVDFHRIGDSIQ